MNLATAWATLAPALHLESGRTCGVTAQQIKALTGVEPRLATKFDHREARPEALKRHTVLPVRNGEYLLVPGDGYHDLERSGARTLNYRVSPERMARTATLPWTGVPSSESQVLDMALASGMLAQFLGESELHLTIRGRLRSPAFDFRFEATTVAVEGVQVEVDAGVEGEHLYLIEAKLGNRDNFHVRQLYYPFRMWSALCAKRVYPLFCCHSDRVFHLWLYEFHPVDDYHGLRLLRHQSYSFEEEVGVPLLRNLLDTSTRQELPSVTLPQADRMERVIDLVDALAAGNDYGFTPRQEGYYLNAAAFVGLVADRRLTALGERFVAGSRAQRHALLLQRLVELPIFREGCEFMEEHARFPSLTWIADMIRQSTDRVSGTTVERRARTVGAWLQWASQHCLVQSKKATQ